MVTICVIFILGGSLNLSERLLMKEPLIITKTNYHSISENTIRFSVMK